MADEEPKALNYVPETILKKRKNTEHAAIRRREQAQDRKTRSEENRKRAFKRAEEFVKEYRTQELDRFRLKRNAKLKKAPVVSSKEAKLVFVIRIGGTNNMDPKTRKVLYMLRLRKIFSGVFVLLSTKIVKLLQMVEPYVTYGYPSLKSVRDLVYKKGVGRLNRELVPLTDNALVEKSQALRQYDILCLEDTVHEITSLGDHFKEVSHFLQPFKLATPEGGLQKMKAHFKNGGDSGNREEKINEFISRMN